MSTLFSRFGFSFKKEEQQASPIVPKNDESSFDMLHHISGFGHIGTAGISGQAASDNKLIERYRDVANMPEVDNAIEEIISEFVIIDEEEAPVKLNTDALPDTYKEKTREKMRKSFEEVLKLMQFDISAYDICRRFYIDGRIYYYLQADPKNLKKGLVAMQYVDPRKIKPVREIEVKNEGNVGMTGSLFTIADEYYVYSEQMIDNHTGSYFNSAPQQQSYVRIEKDAVAFATSGLTDTKGNTILSFLHKALRIATQVKWLEDSVLIYYLSRAPERRAFYISTMNIPKPKREGFMREVMARFTNKITYNPGTGEINDDRKLMNLTDDYWIPRDDVGDATEIKNISGASNLADMTIPVDNFREKLLKSLNVPIARLDPSASVEFSMSATEVTRDELKFSRFIFRLRSRFTNLFDGALKAHLVLKGILSLDEWEEAREYLKYEFSNDNHFSELRDTELLMKRMRIADDAKTMLGMFFTLEHIQKRIMHMTDEDIADVEKYRKENPEFEVDREGNMTQVTTVQNVGKRASVKNANKEDEPAPQTTTKEVVQKDTKQTMAKSVVEQDDLANLDVDALLEKHNIKSR